MRIVNLKSNPVYISQYVQLRNYFKELLMTDPVTIQETQKWLESQDVEVRLLIKQNKVEGAIVLYINKDNEIAIFVKNTGKSLGSELLKAIIEEAKCRNIPYLRAIVRNDNIYAKRFFIKHGFMIRMQYVKKYKGNDIAVIEFIRKIE